VVGRVALVRWQEWLLGGARRSTTCRMQGQVEVHETRLAALCTMTMALESPGCSSGDSHAPQNPHTPTSCMPAWALLLLPLLQWWRRQGCGLVQHAVLVRGRRFNQLAIAEVMPQRACRRGVRLLGLLLLLLLLLLLVVLEWVL